MRRLHGAHRRRAVVLLRASNRKPCRKDRDHRRGAISRRCPLSAAAGVPRRAGRPVRLLPFGHNDFRDRAARAQSAPEPRRDRRGARPSSLPLRRAQSHHAGGRRAGERSERPARQLYGARAGRAAVSALPKSLVDNPLLSTWIGFEEAGRVRLATGKVEIGQGVLTALAQIAAEELDVAPERLRIVSGEAPERPSEGFTLGSNSIAGSGCLLLIAWSG